MHHTRDIALTVSFNRKTVPAVSHGNYKVLEICSHILGIYHGIKLGTNLIVGIAYRPADRM